MNKRLIKPLGLFEDRQRIRIVKIKFDGRSIRLFKTFKIEGIAPQRDPYILVIGLRREVEIRVAKSETRPDIRLALIWPMALRQRHVLSRRPVLHGKRSVRQCGKKRDGEDRRFEARPLGPPRLKFGNGRCSAGPMILQCFENLVHSGSPGFRLRGDEDARRSSARGQPSLSRERSVLRSPTLTSFRGRFVYLFRGIHQYP